MRTNEQIYKSEKQQQQDKQKQKTKNKTHRSKIHPLMPIFASKQAQQVVLFL